MHCFSWSLLRFSWCTTIKIKSDGWQKACCLLSKEPSEWYPTPCASGGKREQMSVLCHRGRALCLPSSPRTIRVRPELLHSHPSPAAHHRQRCPFTSMPTDGSSHSITVGFPRMLSAKHSWKEKDMRSGWCSVCRYKCSETGELPGMS